MADLVGVQQALASDALCLYGGGTDPLRPSVRLLQVPRYACMDAFFSADGGERAAAGRAMMCSTAAVQVSIDAGWPGDGLQSARQRWQRVHAVGPALVAAFACSPVLSGQRTGWQSTRQRGWRVIDPSRTHPPRPDDGPVEALTELAWNARLLALRRPDGEVVAAPALTFGEWASGALVPGHGGPTVEDLAFHLTTLWPPVRGRGWFEVRYLDGLPDPWWQVAVGVVAALMDDDRAADAARAACAPVEGRWSDAARVATADPDLGRAALGCLAAAGEALPRMGAPGLAAVVERFVERFTARGRCPADEVEGLGALSLDVALARSVPA